MESIILTPNLKAEYVGSDEPHVATFALKLSGEAIGLLIRHGGENGSFEAKRLNGEKLDSTRRSPATARNAAKLVIQARAYWLGKAGEAAARRLFGDVRERAEAMGDIVRLQAAYDVLNAEAKALDQPAPEPAAVGVNGHHDDAYDPIPF